MEQAPPRVIWQPQPGAQTLFLQCPVREAVIEGGRGGGKMLANNTEVPTPTGMVQHGKLKPGDTVFAEDGTPTKVLDVTYHDNKPCYKVVLSDGIVIFAGAEHLWKFHTAHATSTTQVGTTLDMLTHMRFFKSDVCIETCGPVEQMAYRNQPTPDGVDPYVVGCLAADPNFRRLTVPTTINGHNLKWHEHIRLCEAMYSLRRATPNVRRIPPNFRFAPMAVRKEVLRGVLAMGGMCSNSRPLAEDIRFLYCSMGGYKARVKKDRKTKMYTVSVQEVKARTVKSITKVENRDCTCIVVDHPSHTYLVTNGFVVTHNSDALIMDFAQHVGCGWGASWRGIIFRQTYPQLTDIISKTKKFFKQIWPDDECTFNKQSSTWTWRTGEELLLRQLKTNDDYLNYHGHEYPFLAFEELCSWHTKDLFVSMISTNRTSHPGVILKIRATTNPFGPGMNWVKRRYQLPHMRNKVLRNLTDEDGNPVHDRVAIFAPLHQNKILLHADPNYLRTIIAAAPNAAARAAWTEGDWTVTAGGALDDIWMDYGKYFIIPPIYLPDNWKLYRAFDWGNSKPFSVGWYAQSTGEDVRLRDGSMMPTIKGDMFRIAEWYGCNPKTDNEGLRMTATNIAEGILDREQTWNIKGRVKAGPADTNIFTNENGHCIADDMQRAGVRWNRANKSHGSRIAGLDKMRTMLKNAQRPREEPALFITQNCEHALRTLPSLPRDEKNLDDVDSDAEDHAYDEIRYMITYTPPSNTSSAF